MSAPPVLEIGNLVKDYRGLRPLRIASLVVREGERVAIAGLDRAAAEAFVNVVNGAFVPDSGEVRVFGAATTDIDTDMEWLASLDRFGMVTERAVLLEGASLEQNLALPFSLDIDPMPEEVRARVRAIAAETDIPEPSLSGRAAEASPALRARVHLARAIGTDPRVLLMEHPTASLPREDVPAFAELVRRLSEARRLTVIALAEDRTFTEIVADVTWKLNPGNGVLSATRGWRRWLGGG
jgi:ABC-type transporter Mla maintaining outer membrane lipid asymmetry ATPase subunit MlaF